MHPVWVVSSPPPEPPRACLTHLLLFPGVVPVGGIVPSHAVSSFVTASASVVRAPKAPCRVTAPLFRLTTRAVIFILVAALLAKGFSSASAGLLQPFVVAGGSGKGKQA